MKTTRPEYAVAFVLIAIAVAGLLLTIAPAIASLIGD